MKIIIRVNREDQELVDRMKADGINAKLVRNATIIEPKQNQLRTSGSHDIPAGLEDASLFIDAAESGGGMTNTGRATVVCGLSGKALKPYYIPKGYSNSDHAYFSVPNALVTVSGDKRSGNVTIEQHDIQRGDDRAWIETTKLWSGELDALPATYDRYAEAAKAAYRKANCYHCREAHFIAA